MTIPESSLVRELVLAGLRKLWSVRTNAEGYAAIVPELSEEDRDQMAVWLVQAIGESKGIDLDDHSVGPMTIGEALLTALVAGIAVGREIERADL